MGRNNCKRGKIAPNAAARLDANGNENAVWRLGLRSSKVRHKILQGCFQFFGPAHLGTTCSTPKNWHNFFSVSPITVHTTTWIFWSLALDFQYRNTSNPLSRGNDRSSRIRSGAGLVPSNTSCKKSMAAAMLFSAITSLGPSFLTTAVDCRHRLVCLQQLKLDACVYQKCLCPFITLFSTLSGGEILCEFLRWKQALKPTICKEP